jgi:hypothetical protein
MLLVGNLKSNKEWFFEAFKGTGNKLGKSRVILRK